MAVRFSARCQYGIIDGLMNLLEKIALWQTEARRISLPAGSPCKSAIGGLPGPAFFPEGYGLTETAMREGITPTFMAIGHNFGCETYRKSLGPPPGREDNIAGTWRSLDRLLRQADADPDLCFRSNWFVGLREGNENDGPFLTKDDELYEEACCLLLLKQIQHFRPKAILLLGPVVAKRAHRMSSDLKGWSYPLKKMITFADIDKIGHTVRTATIRNLEFKANVVALLHPSKGWLNQPTRLKRISATEADLIRDALS
jgi:uracil-DNA glycosylase